ncbi:MAG: hypothetical protein CMJ18_17685 [Phycisphaeraceae bacterium]|nr:hypothetical protein [Phycisphaeraceae bacterium]
MLFYNKVFYNKVEVLSPETHADLRFDPLPDLGFARGATSVPLLAEEFAAACVRFPIVFARGTSESDGADGEVMAHALLSLGSDGNRFIGDNGQWTAPYMPAYIRRYPFVLANLPEDRFAVAFDPECGGFGTEKGDRLYEDGKPSAFLDKEINFLRKVHHGHHRTLEAIRIMQSEELLRPIDINIDRAGNRSTVRNLMAIDEEKLRQIPADKAGEWVANGLMLTMYAQLISMKNLETLV